MNAQQFVGLITGAVLPIAVLVLIAVLTRPWNIRRKSN